MLDIINLFSSTAGGRSIDMSESHTLLEKTSTAATIGQKRKPGSRFFPPSDKPRSFKHEMSTLDDYSESDTSASSLTSTSRRANFSVKSYTRCLHLKRFLRLGHASNCWCGRRQDDDLEAKSMSSSAILGTSDSFDASDNFDASDTFGSNCTLASRTDWPAVEYEQALGESTATHQEPHSRGAEEAKEFAVQEGVVVEDPMISCQSLSGVDLEDGWIQVKCIGVGDTSKNTSDDISDGWEEVSVQLFNHPNRSVME
jgi:hypothetical protein